MNEIKKAIDDYIEKWEWTEVLKFAKEDGCNNWLLEAIEDIGKFQKIYNERKDNE